MVNIDFEFIATSVATILVAGGVLLLLLGYLVNIGSIGAGWVLVVLGIIVFIVEVLSGSSKGRSK
jgi:hypothetical protein